MWLPAGASVALFAWALPGVGPVGRECGSLCVGPVGREWMGAWFVFILWGRLSVHHFASVAQGPLVVDFVFAGRVVCLYSVGAFHHFARVAQGPWLLILRWLCARFVLILWGHSIILPLLPKGHGF